jgi:hypothetical protein
MSLPLFLVERTDTVEDGEYESFIVACEDEETARNTHPSGYTLTEDTYVGDWSPNHTQCVEVTLIASCSEYVRAEVVHTSYIPYHHEEYYPN